MKKEEHIYFIAYVETCGICASIYTLILGLQTLLSITSSLDSNSFELQVSHFPLYLCLFYFFSSVVLNIHSCAVFGTAARISGSV